MDMRKNTSLKGLFMQFLFTLFIFLLVGAVVPVLLLLSGVNFGLLLPANASESALEKAKAEISRAQIFSEESVPQGMEYILLDKSLSMLQTNMEDADIEKALQFAKGQRDNFVFGDRFSLITRDKEYVVLKYSVHSHYVSKALNDVLPPPEIVCYLFIAVNVVLGCVIATLLFAAKLKRQLLPLYKAADQIGNQNLDFDIGHSYIKELNDVLLSFKKMKEELKASLKKQWKDEQEQREQIAALAHDLKTPLTVLYGNLDLLHETKLTMEQMQYLTASLENTGYMEQSIKTLIELSQAASGYSLCIADVNLPEFLAQVQKKATALASLKHIRTEFSFDLVPETLYCDAALLERAVLNILSNAVDFTPEHGTIRIKASQQDHFFMLTVTDSGKGFSKEDMAQGTDRFYMGDSSRSSRHHYGMGLTIAEHIVLKQGGTICLLNDTGDLQGAQVMISIPM